MRLPSMILFLMFALAAVSPLKAADPVRSGYILGPNDQVEVSIYGQPDKGARTRVKGDGTITLPLIGPVKVAGHDVASLAADIEQRLKAGGYVNNPIVNVEVTGFVSRAVTVLGAVGTPGIYPLDYPQTLGGMLARAGGVRDGGSEFIMLRHAGGNQVQRLSIADLALDPAKDIALRSGDTIYIPATEVFYIYGQVNSPGAYPAKGGMTLRQALARSGGPTLAGTERRVQVFRDRKEKVDADLESEVRPNDVLFVRERAF